MTEKKTKTGKNGAKAKASKAAEASFMDGMEAMSAQWQKAFTGSDEMTAFYKENLEAWVDSAKASSESVEKIAAEAVAFHQKTLEGGAAVAVKALSAQSFQDVVEMQSDYTKTFVEGYMSQMSRIGEMWTEGVQAATAPLNSRMSAFMQFAQGNRF